MKTWQKIKNNPDLWQRYFIREQILKKIRSFFEERQFHEVEVPLLIQSPPAESYLEVFETTLLDRYRRPTKGFLSTSPEVPLKKLLVAGIGDCYALTKSFRNMETDSKTHNPEFTILEWYRVQTNYQAIMDDCEALVHYLANNQNQILYQGQHIDIGSAWERLTVKEAFQRYASVDFDQFFDLETAKKIAVSKGYTVETHNTWEELYNQVFLNEVEPHLGHGKPTILYEFPGTLAALSKKKLGDPRYAERFEFYIAGLEMGDCYSELADPHEQEQRFELELAEIRNKGKTVYDYDHDFISALQVGLPECSGIAIGVDRLIMLFADTTDIKETLFFPSEEMFGIEK